MDMWFGTLRSQFVIASKRNARFRPYAFTEQGVAMLSGVLHSPQAIQANVEIMPAFVRLRALLSENRELTRRLDELEHRYDGQFRVVFDAIREIMKPNLPPPKRRIGFGLDGEV